MRPIVMSVVLGLSVLGVACGGSNKEASSAESTKADLGPMDELKAIPRISIKRWRPSPSRSTTRRPSSTGSRAFRSATASTRRT